MTPTRSYMISSAIALICASPALADLTAEQVLEDQLKQMRAYGIEPKVTNQSSSGGTLVVEGISFAIEVPEATMRFEMGGGTFTEQGDGTVQITYPAEIPVTLNGTAEGEDFAFEMLMTQSNTVAIVSGTPEEIRYDFTSDSFGVSEFKFLAPEEMTEIDMSVSFVANGISGFGEFVGGGEIRDYTADYSVESVSASISAAPEQEEGRFDLSMAIQSLGAKYSGRIAPQDLMASLAQSIEAGNAVDGSFTHGPLSYKVMVDAPDGKVDANIETASGTFDFAMGEDGLSYGGTGTNTSMTLAGTMMPLPPLTIKIAESEGRVSFPVVPSEDEQDFGLRIAYQGLEVDPMLWGMIDPAGNLPRDPANIVLDVSGVLTLLMDVFDPEVMAQMAGIPGEINSLDLNELLITLAGAELTGDGAFTFDNSSGLPAPEGVANLMLNGGNTLLDTLVSMGLIPEEQAMGARMMMGLFAQPGQGDDSLVSTIEVKADGSVLANGQRIR